MRSRTLPDLPGRCARCWVKREACICAGLERANNLIEVVFVRHHSEAQKSTSTARIAALVLERSRLLEVGYDSKVADSELAELDGAWLLYPDPAQPAQLCSPPTTLVVLDGTWGQTRRMLRRLTATHTMPRLSLTPPPASLVAKSALRKSHLAAGRSTIEAVVAALALLGDSCGADLLRKAASLHFQSVLRSRGRCATGEFS